jgi:hypothetical protein
VWGNYLYCVDPGESGGFFCFFLAGRRSPLTRAPILCEPEVSLVGKFRFFKVEPSVIESMVLETSSTDDFTIDGCVLDPIWIYIYIYKYKLIRV